MKKEFHNEIVKKSNSIEIRYFNVPDKYIITHKKLGNRIVVNQKTLDLVNLVDGKTSLKAIVEKFNKKNPSYRLSVYFAYKLLYETLGKQGIIINNNFTLKKREIASYLSLSFTLISEKKLHLFIKIISPLISFKHFYKILFFSLSIVLCIVALNYTKLNNYINTVSAEKWLAYMLISGFILLLHEFGHASACKKLGAEPGSIGFGFYLLSPVMFVNVSDIWKLKRKYRIYVNFAGLYIEALIALILASVYLIVSHASLLIICSLVLFSFVVNLNPFLRYDGYWVLSDITNTPNLRKVSIEKLNVLISSVYNKKKINISIKDIFLVSYALISIIFIFIFLAFIIIIDPDSLLSFPLDIYAYGKLVVAQGKKIVLSDIKQFILPCLFYFIVLKFSILWVIKNSLKTSNDRASWRVMP